MKQSKHSSTGQQVKPKTILGSFPFCLSMSKCLPEAGLTPDNLRARPHARRLTKTAGAGKLRLQQFSCNDGVRCHSYLEKLRVENEKIFDCSRVFGVFGGPVACSLLWIWFVPVVH